MKKADLDYAVLYQGDCINTIVDQEHAAELLELAKDYLA